jgi:hypothetical protein
MVAARQVVELVAMEAVARVRDRVDCQLGNGEAPDDEDAGGWKRDGLREMTRR